MRLIINAGFFNEMAGGWQQPKLKKDRQMERLFMVMNVSLCQVKGVCNGFLETVC